MNRKGYVALAGNLLFVICLFSCLGVKPTQDVEPQGISGKTGQEHSSKEIASSFSPQGLNQEQQISFMNFLKNENSPCGCFKNFAHSLNHKEQCRPAYLLAQWTTDMIKRGVPIRQLFKAVSQEINDGFLASPIEIDLMKAHHKGNKNTPITIVEFADFECPACKEASMTLGQLAKENPDQVKIVFMHFPLRIHANAERAAIAAEAAGQQGKFWQMHDKLMSTNLPLSDHIIRALAQSIFSREEIIQFELDRQDPALQYKVKSHQDYARNKLQLHGTPTFFINQRPYHLPSSKEAFKLRLDMESFRDDFHCNRNNR